MKEWYQDLKPALTIIKILFYIIFYSFIIYKIVNLIQKLNSYQNEIIINQFILINIFEILILISLLLIIISIQNFVRNLKISKLRSKE